MEKTRINLLKETLKNGKVKLNFYFKPEEKEIGKKYIVGDIWQGKLK